MDFLGAMGTGKRKVGKAARRGGKKRKTDGGGDSQGLQATAEEVSRKMFVLSANELLDLLTSGK